MNNQMLIDREWFDRVHALLYKISSEDGPNGLEAECLGSFIPGFLQSPAPEGGEPTVVATVSVSFEDHPSGDGVNTIERIETHTLLDEGDTELMTIAQHRAIVAGLGREWIACVDRFPEKVAGEYLCLENARRHQMTPTPAPRDEQREFADWHMKKLGEHIEAKEITAGGFWAAGQSLMWLGWQARAALAESELAEVREQLRQMTKDRDDCVEARLHEDSL